jgi:hypothetical protein
MNEYKNYWLDDKPIRLKKCDTPDCDRLTTADHCCGSCGLAHGGGYEVHESGPLGHSDLCNERQEKRKDLK